MIPELRSPNIGDWSVAARDVHSFSHEAMATQLQIYCAHPDEKYARQAAQFAFDLLGRLEQDLSRFVENSDISRINHLVAGEYCRVSSWTMDCLEIARCVYAESQGAFDISLGSGFNNLELCPGELIVRAHADGILLDLGGVGKGYAVDRMAEVLHEWEVNRALIHAGYSSVLALDSPPGCDSWPLNLCMPPAQEVVLARISARDQALSGSGIRKRDHILDPRSKQSVRHRRAAWVSVPRHVFAESPGAFADAFSTAFMVLSAKEIQECCRRCPGLEAWILQPCDDKPDSPPLFSHFPQDNRI